MLVRESISFQRGGDPFQKLEVGPEIMPGQRYKVLHDLWPAVNLNTVAPDNKYLTKPIIKTDIPLIREGEIFIIDKKMWLPDEKQDVWRVEFDPRDSVYIEVEFFKDNLNKLFKRF